MSPAPLTVYVDQNTLSYLAAEGTAWQGTDLGKLLADDRVEVWVSPVHCLEIAQATDPTLRARLARTALELSAYRRMVPSYESLVVRTFAEWLQRIAPGSVRGWEYVEHHQETAQRTMLAMLMLMAFERPVNEGPLDEILRGKFGTQKLHAEAVSDPVAWIQRLLDCTDKLLVVPLESEESFTAASVDELKEAVREAPIGDGIPKKLRDTLNKRRHSIARAYGAIETGACLLATLRLPVDLDYTFDKEPILARWSELHAAAGTKSVPKPDTSNGIAPLLAQLTFALARGHGLLPATLANEAVIREVQRFASKQQKPNAGVLFDGDHAVYLTHAHVFISDDENLRAATKAMADLVKNETGGKWAPEVVSSTQAVSTLRRLLQ
jgi:hypothetical protein